MCSKTRVINMYELGKLYNKLSAFLLEAVKFTLPREKESTLAKNLTTHRHLQKAVACSRVGVVPQPGRRGRLSLGGVT